MRTLIPRSFWFLVLCCCGPLALGQSLIAHRGASHDAPENTLSAFRLAWQRGADGIEADFRLTADGRIVCIHDPDTERVSGARLVVADSTFSELRCLDVGRWKDPRWTGERIPTLKEILATIPPKKLIFIELKTGPEIVGPLVKVLQQAAVGQEQVVVISFDGKTIAECEKRMPQLKTLWLASYKSEKEDGSGPWSPTAEQIVATLKHIGADGLNSKAERRHFDGAFLQQLRSAGFDQFGVWTVNDAEAALYQALGAVAITTDRPAWLRKQLETKSTPAPTAVGSQPQKHMVPMRDGVRLATDVYLPPEDQRPCGVVLMRTPYDKSNAGPYVPITKHGVALVGQDIRGRYASEGRAQPFTADGWGEHQDGLDTVRWIRKQPWSSGRIVTHGGSAGALTQILLASAGPDSLAGQYMIVGSMSLYHGGFFQSGVFRKSLVERWLVTSRWPDHCLTEIREHPLYDDYWRVQNLGERAEKVNWPTVIVGGWYDIFQQGTLDLFQTIQQRGGPKARQNVHLIMGPWTHGVGRTQVGDLAFPANAEWADAFPRFDRWAAQWLLDKPLGQKVPPVTYYTMGELPAGTAPGNQWRTAPSWPPPSRPVSLYLTDQGALQADTIPQSGRLSFTYDPTNPVPTHGGPNLLIPPSDEQRKIEQRDDVLVFTGPPLDDPMEVTGRVRAVLHVATSAADADFTAKLTDVYPDGRSMLLTDGICRLSLRESLEHRTPVKPGQIVRIEVDLWSTSYIFNRGHRLRLSISSSNSPRLEPNPNPAHQTLHLGTDQPSHLILPVVEQATAP